MIGVCIKYFHRNYGGMLQAFATTKMLEKRNIEYELIRYEKDYSIVQKICFLPRLLNSVLLKDKLEAINKRMGMKKHKEFAENDRIRAAVFDEFCKSHFLNLAEVSVGYEKLKSDSKKYQAIITGSDQLWSPAGLPTNYYNLMFVDDGVRKISYASSFGVGMIPWYQKSRTREYLERIEFISMRENAGKRIVKELTGKDVPVIVDPVFMLSREEWEENIPFKKMYEEPYIFAYFLGKNKSYRDEVSKYAKENGLKIVCIRHMDQYVEEDENFGDYAPYNVGPIEFLNLIRGAEYVCTDSFHGTCFSVINEKKFMVFNRYSDNSSVSKNSRIDSLCDNLGLKDRRYTGNIENLRNDIDFAKVKVALDHMLVVTNEYLDKALDGIE